jgi:hypothetical protein
MEKELYRMACDLDWSRVIIKNDLWLDLVREVNDLLGDVVMIPLTILYVHEKALLWLHI